MKALVTFESVLGNKNQTISGITANLVDRKQVIAVVIPPILVATMYPIFHSLAGVLNDRIAWYLGLSIYWLIWGAAFPLLIIGRENIRALIRPQKPNKKALLLVAIPLVGAAIVSLIPGMGYEKESVWIFLLLLATPFWNGFFEEVLWRGVYVKLFPKSIFYGVLWPNVWFAAWHYAPGSVLNGNVVGLIIGAGVMGLYLSYLTRKTNAIWWSIVVHCFGGIIMIV
jgi:membrane protease YdiL (CAAX protease family)